MSVAANIASIQERIISAARRAGRRPEEIALMAVSKTQPPARIREAYVAGQRLFGENRVQEFAAKNNALQDLHAAEWHMIGHLQTNKATKTAELFRAVDSVDSLKLAEKLDAAARKLSRKLDVLVEINVGGEEAKSGAAPDPVQQRLGQPHRGSNHRVGVSAGLPGTLLHLGSEVVMLGVAGDLV